MEHEIISFAPTSWKRTRLGDVASKIQTGPFGSQLHASDYVESGIPCIMPKNIINGAVDTTSVAKIKEEDAERLSKHKVQSGDIIYSRRGDVEKCALIRKDQEGWLCGTGCLKVSFANSKNLINSRYVAYFLSHPEIKAWIVAHAIGATMPNLNTSILSEVPLLLPPLAVQNAISSSLSCIDEKISINQQINQTLEAMAQALFKSWFVDFEPTRAKIAALDAGGTAEDATVAAMAAISGKSAEELAALKTTNAEAFAQLHTTASLFPSRLVESELGEIPEGWEVKKIKDVAKIIKGKSYKSSELAESRTALVTLKSFNRGGGYRLDGLKEYTGSYKAEQEVFAGDLIIAYTDVTQAADVIGKPAMVISDSRYEHLVISLDVAVVRPSNDALKYFLYGLARTETFQQHTNAHSTGTTVLHLSKDAVPEYQFAYPDGALVTAYERIAKPIFNSINESIEQSSSLTQLRDSLLPKLLSGEIEVPTGGAA